MRDFFSFPTMFLRGMLADIQHYDVTFATRTPDFNVIKGIRFK
ncbi:hypothetical protein SB521682_4949 [Shigella boydii 5216-82]|nr:hypothetical protein SB521682_4949 [Shigella boydii 5216-82]